MAAGLGTSSANAATPDPAVKLETNYGEIIVRLDARKAPISTANFVQYVKSGFYDGTVFHRVIKNFMVQGGGFTADMKQKETRAAIRNEADNGLKNKKYTIAMARTGEPHSATAQFFINTKDNDFLDFKSQTPQGWGYAVFGKVIKGQEVVDKIAAVTTGKKGYYDDVPMGNVIVKKAVVVE
nr:peptidylprolyl isomerase [Desulfovibrio intestinalis]